MASLRRSLCGPGACGGVALWRTRETVGFFLDLGLFGGRKPGCSLELGLHEERAVGPGLLDVGRGQEKVLQDRVARTHFSVSGVCPGSMAGSRTFYQAGKHI